MKHFIRSASLALVTIAWASPAFAGPPFLSDDPDPTPYQHDEIYLFGNATDTGDGVGGEAGVELYHETPDVKHGGATSTAGVGATYDITENLHLLGYVGAGLENTAETGRGTGYASVLFTF